MTSRTNIASLTRGGGGGSISLLMQERILFGRYSNVGRRSGRPRGTSSGPNLPSSPAPGSSSTLSPGSKRGMMALLRAQFSDTIIFYVFALHIVVFVAWFFYVRSFVTGNATITSDDAPLIEKLAMISLLINAPVYLPFIILQLFSFFGKSAAFKQIRQMSAWLIDVYKYKLPFISTMLFFWLFIFFETPGMDLFSSLFTVLLFYVISLPFLILGEMATRIYHNRSKRSKPAAPTSVT